jgi:hypothetical protein
MTSTTRDTNDSLSPVPQTAGQDEPDLGSRLFLITLHLARCPDFPEGSMRHGFGIVAPLDPHHRLDGGQWLEHRARCVVRRFRDGEPDRLGHLVHGRGGAGGATWRFVYPEGTLGDESGFRLAEHRFMPGEYVTIREDNGQAQVFKVASVREVTSA